MTAVRGRLRLRLTVASFLLSLLVVAGAVGALLLVLQRDIDRTVAARLAERSAALAATVTPTRAGVDVTGADEALFDGANWVYDPAGKRIEGPAAPAGLAGTLDRVRTADRTQQVEHGTWRLTAVPVRRRGEVIAVAVTAVNTAPYTVSLHATLRGVLLLGGLAVAGATGLAALVLARSLGPIAEMTDQAEAWNRSRSHQRFALGRPRDELTHLAAVLDDLLDRVDAALEVERRLTAEVAHELRTPLTALQGEAELALLDPGVPASQRERFERVHTAATGMARAVTALLTADHAAAPGAGTSCQDAVRATAETLGGTGALVVHGGDVAVALPARLLERILAPVLDNALSHAAGRVEVRTRADGAVGRIEIRDDGTGIDPSVAASVFEPGVSTRAGGSGLGLALSRRLAREAGGDVELVQQRPAVFEIRLPRVHVR